MTERATGMLAFSFTASPWQMQTSHPDLGDRREGKQKRKDFSLYFYATMYPSGPESAQLVEVLFRVLTSGK